MAMFVGTSGYNYPEWKGRFYPETLPTTKMLPYYAERFSTVEINYTFYRMPNEKIVAGWSEATPPGFRFTLKAPRRITHDARLRNCADLVHRFVDVAATLGPKLGALLFQLPPNLKYDADLLEGFLRDLPHGAPAAFEFRHLSWFVPAVFDRLRTHGVALCVADSDTLSTPVEVTAGHAYFRLRDEGYTSEDVARWAMTIRERTAGCRDTYVYFKHEDEGKGPEFARAFLDALHVPR